MWSQNDFSTYVKCDKHNDDRLQIVKRYLPCVREFSDPLYFRLLLCGRLRKQVCWFPLRSVEILMRFLLFEKHSPGQILYKAIEVFVRNPLSPIVVSAFLFL